MNREIRTFRLFVRPDSNSQRIANEIRGVNLLQAVPLVETRDNEADLVIAVGGDGSFIHAVTNTNFSSKAIYTGIHTGTLGFMQDFAPEDIPKIFEYINSGKKLTTRKVFVASAKVTLADNSVRSFYVLNDILIVGKDYSLIRFEEHIMGKFLQNVGACGINISTHNGDTALSKSLGGSIDFGNKNQLICTLVAPISNAVSERFFTNPITCPQIKIVPKARGEILIKIDGIVKNIDSSLIQSIEVSMLDESLFIQKFDIDGGYDKVDICRIKLLGGE